MPNYIAKTSPNRYTLYNTERQTKTVFQGNESTAELVRFKFSCEVLQPNEAEQYEHFKSVML